MIVKIIAAIGFISIILIAGIVMFKYKETLFRTVATVTYPDNCTEKYINGIMESEECTIGRTLIEQQQPDFQLPNTIIDDIPQWE